MPRASRSGKRGNKVGRAAFAAVGLGALAASAAALPACSSDETCVTTRDYFEQNVWSAFMGTKCTKCHTPDGVAVAEKNAKLVLQPTSYPGFVDANLETLREVVKIQYQGVSELLLKPIGKMDHGGGVQIDEGGPEYKALVELVKRFDVGDTCSDGPSPTLQSVHMLDAKQTFRKAALALGGRLPTEAEMTALAAQGDGGLDAALDALLKEDTFYVRLKEIYNDVLLTDQFLRYGGAALDFLRDEDYPGAKQFKDPNSPKYDSDRREANRAIAQEPLNLISYVVKNDRKFSEIMTADYALVNPFSAQAYGVTDVNFTNSMDPNEYHEGHVTLGSGVKIPHAGVLSTPVFLNRWPTTPTNRNRGRARRVFKFFLATDVLKIATRPVDATKVTAEENPTHNSEYCTVCHKVIDPVAGGFRGYDDDVYAHYDPKIPWHDEMFPPGFDGANMDPGSYDTALQWLTTQIAHDPRFVISAVYTMYQGLTGHDPLTYPADPSAPDFQDKLSAWTAQDQFFRDTATAFANSNMNLKTIVKTIVKSVYYRAIDVDEGISPTLLAGVGTGHLLTPEMLNRKIMAVLGVPWRKDYEFDQDHFTMLEDYKILYGGIDSESTVTRLTVPNGVIASIAQRMAEEVACEVTAFDFIQPQEKRRYFKYVDELEVPESSGHTVDGSVADTKKNIQYLHSLILGEDLAIDDPEIGRTYQLYLDTWRELSKTGYQTMPYNCWGRINWATGEKVPDSAVKQQDAFFTLRSWQAVMTYLLSDYKFLHE